MPTSTRQGEPILRKFSANSPVLTGRCAQSPLRGGNFVARKHPCVHPGRLQKSHRVLPQLHRNIGSNSVLQKRPGAVQDALGVGKNDLLVLARTERDLGGEDAWVFGVEKALFLQDAQKVQKLLRVVGTVRIAEARVLVAVAVAVGVRDRVSVVEMRDIRPERTDDKAGVLMRDGNVAEVDDEAEVLVPRAHIGGKARS